MKKMWVIIPVFAGMVFLALLTCSAEEDSLKAVKLSDLTFVSSEVGTLKTDILKEIEKDRSLMTLLNQTAKNLSDMPLYDRKVKDKLFLTTTADRPRFSFDIPLFGAHRLEVSFHLDQKKPSPIETDQKKDKILSSQFSIRW
jgi:hypothetical protein